MANLPDLPASGLLLLRGASSFAEAGEAGVPLLQPRVASFWIPALLAVLAAMVGFQIVKSWVGGRNTRLAVAHTVLQVAFSGPIIALALTGSIINPAFATEIRWPPLAEGTGPVMLAIAVVALLATAWEIFDAFRRARHPRLEMEHAT